jgi:imidazolonepropionase
MNEQECLEDILKVQLPAIIEEKSKGTINPEFIDVFCEKNIFEVESTR